MTTTPVDWRLRGTRAAMFAAVCVSLSAAGHVWMSGSGIPLWALAVAFAAVTAVGFVCAGRQRGFLSISALMLLGELGQHLLFTSAQNAISPVSEIPAIPQFVSGRVVPASAWICGMPHSRMTAGHGSGMTGVGGTAGMIAAHVVAGLLCAGWLRSGEAAVFRLLQTLAGLAAEYAAPLLLLFAWPATSAVPGRPGFAPVSSGDIVARRTRLLSTVLARRGPPNSRICIL